MRDFQAATRSTSAMITILLVVAILSSQWAGFAHRIAHASYKQQAGMSAVVITHGVDKSIEHSCLLFDAATLASSIDTSPYTPRILPSATVLALWQAFASWDAPLLCHFSSRAPPHR